MKFMLEKGAKVSKGYYNDGGYDIHSRDNRVICSHDSELFDTGVHVEIPKGYVGFLKSKSGLNIRYGLTGEGVIDSGYTGSIKVKLYNNSDDNYYIMKEDKIIQLVVIPCLNDDIEIVDEFSLTERGNNGFGSTGRK